MSNKNAYNTTIIIIALAYFHRYGSMAIMFGSMLLFPKAILPIASVGCITFSLWTFIGYKCRWKHIYCSYQNAYHRRMTPNSINWGKIKKSDAYGIPIIFMFLGLMSLLIVMLESI